ncbi:MAG: ABC transporter ATP-binding protein [Bacteroidota bacterium]
MKERGQRAVLELRGASRIYQAAGRGTTGLYPTDLRVYPGEVVLLLGPSGSGKTTLLTLAGGLVAPSSGSVAIDGCCLDELSPPALQQLRASRIGIVFQSFNLIDALTTLENVALVPRFTGLRPREAMQKARSVLVEIGIAHLAAQFPPELSQGEKQRVVVARAIATHPGLLLADEPTASLDTENGLNITQVLRRYAKNHDAAVLVATHDLRLIEHADRVIHLSDGRVMEIEESVSTKLQAPILKQAPMTKK